jgi:hypothetical protein
MVGCGEAVDRPAMLSRALDPIELMTPAVCGARQTTRAAACVIGSTGAMSMEPGSPGFEPEPLRGALGRVFP